MTRRVFSLILAAAIPSLVQAHFLFMLPEPGNAKAVLFLSETLKPEPGVGMQYVANAKLEVRNGAGKETALTLTKGDEAYLVDLPPGGRVMHGLLDLGYTQRGPSKPHLLLYYPKTILGEAFDPRSVVGEGAVVEIVPVGKPGAVALKLIARGNPLAGAEINVVLPDGRTKKMKTGAEGVTETLTEPGRYGAWARFWEPAGGERDGKKYEETRHYATLVFDAPKKPFATLPEATSSMGTVVSDGWLYVYGGHISPTHSYSTAAVSGKFNRLNLATGVWEPLPGGQPLQGMNLAAHDGKIYLIGGMSPRNAPGTPSDTHSVADCARFDPATKEWEKLPALPEPRSSHDVVVIGSKVIVVGGWMLKGAEPSTWAHHLEVLDLAATKLEWKSAPQPFARRALIAAAHGGKMYVIGGFDDKSKVIKEMAIYDPATGDWTKGPELPVDQQNSFAPAAAVHHGRLYVSVADGTLYRLDGNTWAKAGQTTPRLAHRVVPSSDGLLVVGGAAKGNNSALVEAVNVPQ
jgi:hypothetical protein